MLRGVYIYIGLAHAGFGLALLAGTRAGGGLGGLSKRTTRYKITKVHSSELEKGGEGREEGGRKVLGMGVCAV